MMMDIMCVCVSVCDYITTDVTILIIINIFSMIII